VAVTLRFGIWPLSPVQQVRLRENSHKTHLGMVTAANTKRKWQTQRILISTLAHPRQVQGGLTWRFTGRIISARISHEYLV